MGRLSMGHLMKCPDKSSKFHDPDHVRDTGCLSEEEDSYVNDDLQSNSGDVDNLLHNLNLEKTNVPKVKSLLDLAAFATAKYKNCEDLEQMQPPLDEHLLKKIALWAFPQDEEFVEAIAALCYTDKAKIGSNGKTYDEWRTGKDMMCKDKQKYNINMWQVGFMATAQITNLPSTPMTQVLDFELEEGEIDLRTASPLKSNNSNENEVIKVSLTFERQQITSSNCSECSDCFWCRHVVAAVLYNIHHPSQVPQYAPITDVLSSLSRDQLQKLLQYTIQEDPEYILDKVLKNIDAVRDIQSSMNTSAGAPDPTFGLDDAQQVNLTTSKNLFEDHFRSTLDKALEISSMYYVGRYDWSLKVNTDFHQFVGKILDLHKSGHYHAALQLFYSMLQQLIQKLHRSITGTKTKGEQLHDIVCDLQQTGTNHMPQSDEVTNLVFTIHDIVHLIVLCLISNNQPDPTYQITYYYNIEELERQMLSTAQLQQSEDNFETLQDKDDLFNSSAILHSEWAELPHLVTGCSQLHLDGKLTNLGQRFMKNILGEALAARYVTPWPPELLQLLESKTEWKNSEYNENIVLMLLRVECLAQESDCKNCDYILRFLPIILRKLTLLAQQYSLLGEYVDWHDSFDLNHQIPALRPSKFQNCKNVFKRRKLVGHDYFEPQLSQPQICYALLYCLHLKKVCEDTGVKLCEGPLTTAPFCFLALELSRSRLYENSLSESEQSWLDRLETYVAEQIEVQYGVNGHRNLSTLVVEDNNMILWYLDALGSDGDAYYKQHIPMQLLKILFTLIQKKKLQRNLSDKIVNICSAIVTRIRTSLAQPLPTGLCARNKDFSMVADLVEMFFECVNIQNEHDTELLIQMMKDLSVLSYDNVLKRAFSAFYSRHFSEDCHPSYVSASFQFALNALNINSSQESELGNNELHNAVVDRWRDCALNHIKKCVISIGLPALTEIIKFSSVCGLSNLDNLSDMEPVNSEDDFSQNMLQTCIKDEPQDLSLKSHQQQQKASRNYLSQTYDGNAESDYSGSSFQIVSSYPEYEFPHFTSNNIDMHLNRQDQPPVVTSLWTGTLQWQEKNKDKNSTLKGISGTTLPSNLECDVSIDITIDVDASQWPDKLFMQLIPINLLDSVQELCMNPKMLVFTFSNKDIDIVTSLQKVLVSGFMGYIHVPSSDVQVLMLRYSKNRKQFVGFIPKNVTEFVKRIRSIKRGTKHLLELPKMSNTFSCDELSDIVCLLKDSILECTQMPKEVYVIIQQCVSQPNDIAQIPELLDLFRSSIVEFSDFLSVVDILILHYNKLSSGRLFTIAKIYEEKSKDSTIYPQQLQGPFNLNPNKLRNEKTMVIIEKAFDKLGEEQDGYFFHSCQEDHVKWSYNYFIGDGDIGSDAFCRLIEIIKKHGNIHPKLVLLLFDVTDIKLLDFTPTLTDLKKCLLEAYKTYFICMAKTLRTVVYNKLVKNMKKDQESFLRLFGTDSTEDFNKIVVEGVKIAYKSRRRLLKMLSETFVDDGATTSTSAT